MRLVADGIELDPGRWLGVVYDRDTYESARHAVAAGETRFHCDTEPERPHIQRDGDHFHTNRTAAMVCAAAFLEVQR